MDKFVIRLFAYYLVLASVCRGYNVDILSPLVVKSGLGADEHSNYSFGFSIAHHTFSNGEKVLLVGAPGAKYDGLTEGGIYACPLLHQQSCERHPVFNFRNNSFNNFQLVLINDDSSYDGQMLGFSVKSNGNSVMACAPLYVGRQTLIDTRTYYRTTGRCVALEKDFLSSTAPTQLHLHNDFGVAGVGIDIYTDTDSSERYVIGAVRTGDTAPVPGGVFVLKTEPFFVRVVYKTGRSSPLNAQLKGYQIKRGFIYQNTSKNIIASGPKADKHRGQVIVYSETSTLNELLTLTGPASSIDGYFGFDFAVVDLQTNGYHSIVVGCPLCDEDNGLVYVYIHTGNPTDPFNETDVRILSLPNQNGGLQQRGAQFGTAVENVGDVDQDGFEDIAISAPYFGNGKVYLYSGSQNGFLTDDYQVIPAPDGKVGFGQVIEGGIDVDSNNYPDFTVTDLNNFDVYTFRGSPLIDVSISTSEKNFSLDYTDRNCVLQNIPSICFNVTPCFNFSTKYGGVDEFAVNYTIIVDEIEQRVGLHSDIQKSRITATAIINNSEEKSCADTTYQFVLIPDFSKLDPIPLKISITNPSSLFSLDETVYGDGLHPILSKQSDGMVLDLQIIPNYVQNCGGDGICNPRFDVLVKPSLMTQDGMIPWASGYVFRLDVDLVNRNHDSLASSFFIDMPRGIRYVNHKSTTDFAISSCETQLDRVLCSLKNPILVDEHVKFQLFFRPDVIDNTFEQDQLVFNFTVQDTIPRGSYSLTLAAKAIASYQLMGSFGVKTEQASRFIPSANQSTQSLSSQGPSVNYQVTLDHLGFDDEESPIPSLTVNILWPAILVVERDVELPLLVPTAVVTNGSNSATCRQYNAIPNHLLPSGQQSGLVLPNITGDFSTIYQYCPNNITCGLIQCEIRNLQPKSRNVSLATPPVQISIFSTLWSASVREVLGIDVYVDAVSGSELPLIHSQIKTDVLANIELQPAVTETQRECFQLWIIIASVLGGLVLAFCIVAVLGVCGCFGRGYYKKKREEEQQKRMRERNQLDGSLRTRIIAPDNYLTEMSKAKEKELEDERDAADSDNNTNTPATFAPFSSFQKPPKNEEEEITDSVVKAELPEIKVSSSVNTDLETEI